MKKSINITICDVCGVEIPKKEEDKGYLVFVGKHMKWNWQDICAGCSQKIGKLLTKLQENKT